MKYFFMKAWNYSKNKIWLLFLNWLTFFWNMQSYHAAYQSAQEFNRNSMKIIKSKNYIFDIRYTFDTRLNTGFKYKTSKI